MEINTIDYETLKNLEGSMWKPQTRFDKEYLEQTLAPDFFEFGRSGRIYTKEITMSAPMQEINAKFPLKDFQIKLIDENVALITYISEVQYEELEIANRSSIWSKTLDGWQMRFHQGTPVK
ncbi:MAG: hypothetical protein A2816_00480 [Candidatus Yanofskybacteria bacterium RIFCSPHIGHO2_01_FULL_39_44]|uniref:DUF4440 domain-containing protein n=1 Tax=Candidatus Yanofskybacteria bacterium RIFCSPHIGHO2_02_FULL_43_22 TaxID=1802681 RepID=A0A1F8FPU0_9BACT|nr:MAG: hypothetical protein A2816_00480 [Candidatus Yanofskybacteria bacterium RIFCSPHIGHO2_01_FULL_39_44]OGN14568.1 MAG: hypothetical protein A3J47_00305 [Candidatus Yanofskybacteria bacterium RIFCSPHIGHO2_02_FULL_43_22]